MQSRTDGGSDAPALERLTKRQTRDLALNLKS